MQLTEWIIDKSQGEDHQELLLDDGRMIVSIVRKRRGKKTTTASTFNSNILFQEDNLDNNEVLLKLLESLKCTYADLCSKFLVNTPNFLGYTKDVFMRELRQFVMDIDPNCIVPKKHHLR